MGDTVRKRIEEYKQNPQKAIEQLEWCGYECEGGFMVNNIAWLAVKELLTGNKEGL